MARFRSLEPPKRWPDAFSRVDLPWNRVGKVAVFHWRLSMDRYSRPVSALPTSLAQSTRNESLRLDGWQHPDSSG